MATLNDLPIPSLSSLDDNEGITLILSIRERRRLQAVKPVREPKPKSAKQIPTEATIAKMSEQQITDLYYALMAKQQRELL